MEDVDAAPAAPWASLPELQRGIAATTIATAARGTNIRATTRRRRWTRETDTRLPRNGRTTARPGCSCWRIIWGLQERPTDRIPDSMANPPDGNLVTHGGVNTSW